MSPFAFERPSRSAVRVGSLMLMLGMIGVGLFLTSNHYSRLALESYEQVEKSAVMYTSPVHSEPATITHVLDLIEPLNSIENKPELGIQRSESPVDCLEALKRGQFMDCYNTALATIELLQQNGMQARLWNLSSTDGFGGNGHNVIEYWSTAKSRWEMLDPFYGFYVTKVGSSKVLSVSEVRKVVLTTPEKLKVNFLKDPIAPRDAASLIAEYAALVPTASLHQNTDLKARYEFRYAGLMPLADIIELLPMQVRRGLRSALLGSRDTKMLIVDKHTPNYQLGLYKTLWYAAVGFVIMGVFLLLIAPMRYVTRPVRRRLSRSFRYA